MEGFCEFEGFYHFCNLGFHCNFNSSERTCIVVFEEFSLSYIYIYMARTTIIGKRVWEQNLGNSVIGFEKHPPGFVDLEKFKQQTCPFEFREYNWMSNTYLELEIAKGHMSSPAISAHLKRDACPTLSDCSYRATCPHFLICNCSWNHRWKGHAHAHTKTIRLKHTHPMHKHTHPKS